MSSMVVEGNPAVAVHLGATARQAWKSAHHPSWKAHAMPLIGNSRPNGGSGYLTTQHACGAPILQAVQNLRSQEAFLGSEHLLDAICDICRWLTGGHHGLPVTKAFVFVHLYASWAGPCPKGPAHQLTVQDVQQWTEQLQTSEFRPKIFEQHSAALMRRRHMIQRRTPPAHGLAVQ